MGASSHSEGYALLFHDTNLSHDAASFKISSSWYRPDSDFYCWRDDPSLPWIYLLLWMGVIQIWNLHLEEINRANLIKEDVRSYNIGEKVSNFADIIHEFFPGLWNVAAKGRRPNSSRRRRTTANMQPATISDTGRAQKIKSWWCKEKKLWEHKLSLK